MNTPAGALGYCEGYVAKERSAEEAAAAGNGQQEPQEQQQKKKREENLDDEHASSSLSRKTRQVGEGRADESRQGREVAEELGSCRPSQALLLL